MSPDPQLDIAAAAAIDMPPTTDQLTPNETLEILRRLKHVFNLADDLISGDLRGRIWAIHGIAGGLAPTVESLESREELCELIMSLRAKHNAEPENRYYLHMFYGQRWSVQKGRVWKLWDGRILTPIQGGTVEDYLDETGGMGDRQDLDTVVATPPVAPVETAPEEELQSTPTPETEVRSEPPTVGEEHAPPGTDPEID